PSGPVEQAGFARSVGERPRLLVTSLAGSSSLPGRRLSWVVQDPVGAKGWLVAEVEIGIGKSGRRAYGFDDIAIVPSRRTRDPEDVDISWEIDAFTFALPWMGSAMDGVISPATAIEIGRLGGVGVLNLEGLWTRYDDPD